TLETHGPLREFHRTGRDVQLDAGRHRVRPEADELCEPRLSLRPRTAFLSGPPDSVLRIRHRLPKRTVGRTLRYVAGSRDDPRRWSRVRPPGSTRSGDHSHLADHRGHLW